MLLIPAEQCFVLFKNKDSVYLQTIILTAKAEHWFQLCFHYIFFYEKIQYKISFYNGGTLNIIDIFCWLFSQMQKSQTVIIHQSY